MKLGTLKRLKLREYWKHEALDFTNWLSEPDNIALLSDEVGIGIDVIQTEASVGRFNVDILAQEENTGKKIIIENQLEVTDHSHLGQLVTYAAGLEAQYVIWIVREVREEHRQALDWLNEHTDDEINFFLVALQLWQIEDSPPAPKFHVISRPNEWKRSVRTSTQEGDLTDTTTKQLEFWQQLKEFAAENYPELKLRTPRPQHWFDVAIGRADCHVCLIVDSRQDKVRCELYIPDSKELYKVLLASKEQIEKELGFAGQMEWRELPGKKACRIQTLHGFKFNDTTTWNDSFQWLSETTLKFRKLFSKNWRQS
ncbi:DUF4268 domain-containing protein [bacterium]|nr:DUF4268 domain-containing protein [bacterium]